MSVDTLSQKGTNDPVVQEAHKYKQYFALLRSPLWIYLIIALAVRILLVIRSNGVIDGDEALVGIQAQHILRGELPIYFYGIPYFGSLEAYLVAFVFAIAGSSVWALRAEPTLLALVIVWLTWRFAAALADFAQLPAYARQQFLCAAALCAAVLPLYDAILEMRTFGGYVETFVLMLLLLHSVLQLTRAWCREASRHEFAWRWAGIGLVTGVGMWVDPIIISAVAAAALWMIGFCAYKTACLQRQHTLREALFFIWEGLRWSPVAIPAYVIGCAPAIYWGAMHQWQNVTYMFNLGNNMSSLAPRIQAQYPDRLALSVGLVKLYGTCVVPRVLGGALPEEGGGLLTALHTLTLSVGVICTFATALLVGLSFYLHRSLLTHARRLAALPLLFGASTVFFFCTSTAAVQGLGCGRDMAGRYATPLMLSLPFFFATIFTLLSMCIHADNARSRREPTGRVECMQHLVSVSAFHRPSRGIAQGALCSVLLIFCFAQAATYGLTDAGYTFQSPYCTRAPANNDPIIAYLVQEHIRYAWAANWVGYPLVFKMGGSITVADPQPVMKHMVYFNRFPADVQAVLHARRSSFLVMVSHGDRHPKLLRMFDEMRVTYHAVFFSSEPGTDILVVTPVSRSVSPFEAEAYFGIFHCSS
ncbi:MAG: hypothetical protein ACJ795_03470 [Ktedonobacteraceae bacterium]